MNLRRLVLGLGIVLLITGASLVWPPPSYDRDRVISELRELAEPYQSMTPAYYMDGGSVGFTIIDRNGKKLELALPVVDDYKRLFVGGTHVRKGASREVELNADTRRMLCAQLAKQRNDPLTSQDDLVLAHLRGSPLDCGRLLWNGIVHRGALRNLLPRLP